MGKEVTVARYRSVLGRDGSALVGLKGKVVWDEGGEEVVVAFEHEIDSGAYEEASAGLHEQARKLFPLYPHPRFAVGQQWARENGFNE
jgi:hypothetical protein